MAAEQGSDGRDSAPEVSVVLPTHNRRSLLAQTLHTIRWQRAVDLEIVVVDDGSSDGTAEFVASLGDDRIRVVRNEAPLGVAAARNLGIAQARGPWIGFCDDDDLWAPDKLAEQLTAAKETGREWVYTGAVNVTVGLRVVAAPSMPVPEQVERELPEWNVVPGGASGVIASRNLLDRAGRFDVGLGSMADWDLWLRMVALGPPAGVARPLVGYRVHARNMSLNTTDTAADFEIVAPRAGRASYAMLYRWFGWWRRRVGQRGAAVYYFIRAVLVRDGRYRIRDFLNDVFYVLREALEVLRLRFASRLVRRSLVPTTPRGRADWIAEAEGWIDEIRDVGSSNEES